jgi:hypothetical protein
MAHRRLGRLPQGKDDRDHIFTAALRLTGSLPAKMDPTSAMPKQLNQADEGSCGPNTASEMIQYDQKVESLAVVPPSRNFIYWNTRLLQGTVASDSGVSNRTMLKALRRFGFCPEALWTYDPKTMLTKPAASCYAAATPEKITDYAAVQVAERQMKACIASGTPFMFGFDVYQGMMTDECAETGHVPIPKAGESAVGGHDITAYAYDDQLQLLRCRNHWVNDDGTPWGDHGDALIPYAYAFNRAWVSDLWMIRTVPGEQTVRAA